MYLPKICGRSPIEVDAIKDKKYAWCSCGLSVKQQITQIFIQNFMMMALLKKNILKDKNSILICVPQIKHCR